MEPIRVLIVDDHPMVRRGLRSLLSSFEDLSVVGEADCGATALRAVINISPDVILLDIQMGGAHGVSVAVQLHKEAPQSKIIILTAYDNDEYLLGALQAGAHAYLLKSSSDETVVEAIRQVHQGRRLLSAELMDRVLQEFQGLAQAQVRHQSELSEEELKILNLMASGATNEEVAKEMYWSERTAKRKVEETLSKMGAKNRAQAVAEAVRKGLI